MESRLKELMENDGWIMKYKHKGEKVYIKSKGSII